MSKKSKPMTPKDAQRIQSATAKKGGGTVKKRSFTARAMKTASKNKNGGKGE